jgi:hypothetical protein
MSFSANGGFENPPWIKNIKERAHSLSTAEGGESIFTRAER